MHVPLDVGQHEIETEGYGDEDDDGAHTPGATQDDGAEQSDRVDCQPAEAERATGAKRDGTHDLVVGARAEVGREDPHDAGAEEDQADEPQGEIGGERPTGDIDGGKDQPRDVDDERDPNEGDESADRRLDAECPCHEHHEDAGKEEDGSHGQAGRA